MLTNDSSGDEEDQKQGLNQVLKKLKIRRMDFEKRIKDIQDRRTYP